MESSGDMVKGSISNIIKKLKSGNSFFSNFLITSSGAIFSVVLQIVFAPIISRIYSPEAYGVLGIFNVLVANISVFASGAYQEALMLPKDEKGFFSLSKLIFYLSLVSAVIVAVLIICFGEYLMTTFFDFQGDIGFLYFLLPMILIVVFQRIVTAWNVRNKEFYNNAKTNVVSNLASRLLVVFYGLWWAPSAVGLILGNLFQPWVRTITLLRGKVHLFWNEMREVSFSEVISIAKEYNQYPKFVIFSEWIRQFAHQLPIWIIGYLFSIKEIGLYSYAVAMLSIPLNVLGKSIKPVFFQRVTEFKNRDKLIEIRDFTENLFIKTVLLGALPLGFLVVFAPWLFEFIFGAEWKMSGVITSYIAISFFFQLLSFPFSSIRRVMRMERRILSIEIISFVLRGTAFVFAYFYPNFELIILYQGVVTAVFYLIDCIDIIRIVKGNTIKMLIISIGSISLSVIFFYGMKLLIF